MQYFTQVDCSLLFHGHYNTRSKGFNEEIYTSLYCPGGRCAIFHSASVFALFCMVMGYNIIQEVKRLTKKFYCLGAMKNSFYAKFQVNCSHCLPFLHGGGLHCQDYQ